MTTPFEFGKIEESYTPHPNPLPGGEGSLPAGQAGVRGDFKLIGADNIKLHLENIEWYRKSAKRKKETQRDLEAIQNEITRLANQRFSKELREWLKLKDRLNGNLLNLPDYLKRTADLILNKMPQDQFQNRYPNVGLLLSTDNPQNPEIVEKIKALDYKILFKEIDQIENDLADLELPSQEDRKIYRYHKELSLLNRLNDIALSPVEYDAVKDTLNGLTTQQFADFIARITGKSIVLSKHWESALESAIQFYETAQARNKSIEKHLDEFIQNKEEQTAVLVFGGFHKEELQEIFEAKNISYHIVTPTITSLDETHRAYYKNLMRMASYPFEIPMNLAKASRNLTIFGRARIIGTKAVRSELRAISLLVERGASLETAELRRIVFSEFQSEQTNSLRSEMRTIFRDETELIEFLEHRRTLIPEGSQSVYDPLRNQERSLNKLNDLGNYSGNGGFYELLQDLALAHDAGYWSIEEKKRRRGRPRAGLFAISRAYHDFSQSTRNTLGWRTPILTVDDYFRAIRELEEDLKKPAGEREFQGESGPEKLGKRVGLKSATSVWSQFHEKKLSNQKTVEEEFRWPSSYRLQQLRNRSELRLAPTVAEFSTITIRENVENLQGRFTVFVDLADIAALTDEQFSEDYEKIALRHKNVSFVFYNAEAEMDPERRERLEKLQEQLGLERIEITSAPVTEILTRQWFGKLIHVSKGRLEFDSDLIQAAALRKDIYFFRYIESEIGVVPTALVFADQDIKGFEGKVIDLSMVSERLRSEVREYLASLVIGRAA